MAATGTAKSLSGLDELGEKQKGRMSSDEGADVEETARLLTLEEARCPVCLEILLEPVTMPCRHSVCLPCFKQTVEFISLCCPLCRLRVSSWARRQSRKKSLVNTELWDMVRRCYPDRCKRRIERREGDGAAGGKILCKSEEIRQEYEQQQKKIIMNEEKRRAQSSHEMEDYGIPKHCKESLSGVLSDLENEEPVERKTRYVSAFVRKTRSSPASNRILQNRLLQRSRSCTDTEAGRGKEGSSSQLAAMAQACIAYSYNAGILLSSENSHSLSAPVLIPDKKHLWRGVIAAATSLTVPVTKPERSISPESNDSISEELNHFKPIVCSPCTPPKRLPDGRLIEPTIVKSTPRNLNRSLQKPTSYEASPTILQKWKQIEMDRQHTKFSSKGTITSPVFEDFTLKKNSYEEKSKFCKNVLGENVRKGHGSGCLTNTDTTGQERGKTSICNKRRLIFDQAIGEQNISLKKLSKVYTPPKPLSTKAICVPDCQAFEETETGSVNDGIPTTAQDRQILLLYNNCAEVIQCNQKVVDTQDQRLGSNPRNGVKSRPTSRRGRKRSQKTKHLEVTGRTKKSRPQSQDVFDTESDVGCMYECLEQEKEDHKLALKLQRQFNMECKKVDRRRTCPDKYLLRSWVFSDSSVEYNPRRSVRIFKKS